MFRRKALTRLALGSALSIAAIACGTDGNGAPASGGNDGGDSVDPTPPPSSIQSGYDAVRQAIEANGGVVVNVSDEPSGTFDGSLTRILINGHQAEVYEFTGASDADAAAITVSDDGTMITRDDGPSVAIDYLYPPHYFKQGNVIVVYTGANAGVIELLRETLGEEFAGDRSPAQPGPDYETVLTPAPIERVLVIEDPDQPGFFLLNVTSGLPNGCARFNDASVTQTGELELTLTVLNSVPAPGELIACTDDYRIFNTNVPLGSAQDNLDACEVYTVRWESYGKEGSVRFQVTAPNIRCVAPEEPIGGGDDPVISPIISDVDALIFGLEAQGIKVSRSEELPGELFGFESHVLIVNGERVDVYLYGPGDAALKAAAGVSPDGGTISLGPNGPVMSFMWISQPHFYLAGNSIVVYVGVNDEIITALDNAAGRKFAGPDSKPILVLDEEPLPLPGDPDHVEVEAPVVSVGEIVIAESFPPQYFIQVRSAQPNGCDLDAGWEVEVADKDVFIRVLNSQPADLSAVLCMQIYGETEHNVALGSNFESGETYNLFVNGKDHGMFTAQ